MIDKDIQPQLFVAAIGPKSIFDQEVLKKPLRYIKIDFSGPDKSVRYQKPVDALFDTGAVASVFRMDVIEAAQRAGKVLQRETVDEFTLHGASGEKLEVDACYRLRFRALNRNITAWVVGVKDLEMPCILGMNFIAEHGLQLDVTTGEITFADGSKQADGARTRQEMRPDILAAVDASQNHIDNGTNYLPSAPPLPETPSWVEGQLRVNRRMFIKAGEARQIRVRLTQANGEAVPNADFVGSVGGVPIVASTDEDCGTTVYFRNASPMDITLPRGHSVGTAENLSLFEAREIRPEDLIGSLGRDPMEHPNKSGEAVVGSVRAEPVPCPHNKRKAIERAINATVKKDRRKGVIELLTRYHQAVSITPHELGRTDLISHDVKTRDHEPQFTKQFHLPDAHYQVIKENMREWLRAGIIEPANSSYNSPVFCVQKPEGRGLRVVLDYRKVNSHTLPERYSIRSVEECLAAVGKAKSRIFSGLDLRSGFWQMNLTQGSRKYTAFTLPGFGQHQWTTSPMGLEGCPASFARLMDLVMLGADHVITYIDDLLVHSRNLAEHMEHLGDALARLTKHGLMLNLDKCVFAADSVAYLGHTVTKDGVLPGASKTAVINSLKEPRTAKEVRAFIGVTNYFRGFINNFAIIAGPLYHLTSSQSGWRDNTPMPSAARQAFHTLKEALVGANVLAYPMPDKKFHLFVDASLGVKNEEGGMGACLMQETEEGVKRPVAFASRRLKQHERNYSAFLIEQAAACWAMEHFRHYLTPNAFVLYSDHRPLEKLKKVHTKTHNRLQMMMEEFHFEIRYVPGKENTVADYLSRFAQPRSQANAIAHAWAVSIDKGSAMCALDGGYTRLREMQYRDPLLGPCGDQLSGGEKADEAAGKWAPWIPNLSFSKDNIIMIQLPKRKGFSSKEPLRMAMPDAMIQEALREGHNGNLAGHGGTFRTLERIRELFFWPGMEEDVSRHIRECVICGEARNPTKTATTPLTPFPQTCRPNERVHMDLCGPLKVSGRGRKYILVVTDAFTRIVSLHAIPDKTAATTAKAFVEGWCFIYGVPKLLVTDQGQEFKAKLAKEVYDALGIEHRTTTPYHPQCNGSVERFNRTMMTYLRKAVNQAEEDTVDWEAYLPQLAFSYNTGVHKATMQTPFFTMFGYNSRATLWEDEEEWVEERTREVPTSQAELRNQRLRELLITRKTAAHNHTHQEIAQKDDFDKRHKVEMATFKAGDTVWLKLDRNDAKNPKINGKRYEPGVVIEQVKPAAYKVHRPKRVKKKTEVVNVSKMSRRFVSSRPDAQLDEPCYSDDSLSDAEEEEEETESEEEDEAQPNDATNAMSAEACLNAVIHLANSHNHVIDIGAFIKAVYKMPAGDSLVGFTPGYVQGNVDANQDGEAHQVQQQQNEQEVEQEAPQKRKGGKNKKKGWMKKIAKSSKDLLKRRKNVHELTPADTELVASTSREAANRARAVDSDRVLRSKGSPTALAPPCNAETRRLASLLKWGKQGKSTKGEATETRSAVITNTEPARLIGHISFRNRTDNIDNSSLHNDTTTTDDNRQRETTEEGTKDTEMCLHDLFKGNHPGVGGVHWTGVLPLQTGKPEVARVGATVNINDTASEFQPGIPAGKQHRADYGTKVQHRMNKKDARSRFN